MKKICLLISIVMLCACSFINNPKNEVDKLFKKYNSLDEDILNDLELVSEGTMFNSADQKTKYYNAMKKQYSDLKYTITDENIDGDEASVTVNIEVYDYYKSQKESDNYLVNNKELFIKDGVYDSDKFLSYKLDQLLDYTDRVEYTVVINLKKEDNEWKIQNLNDNVLKKIHGTYNYEND